MKVAAILQYDSKISKFTILKDQDHQISFIMLTKPHHFFNIFGHDHDIKTRIAQVHSQHVKNLESSIHLQFGQQSIIENVGLDSVDCEMVVVERGHEMLPDIIKITTNRSLPLMVV